MRKGWRLVALVGCAGVARGCLAEIPPLDTSPLVGGAGGTGSATGGAGTGGLGGEDPAPVGWSVAFGGVGPDVITQAEAVDGRVAVSGAFEAGLRIGDDVYDSNGRTSGFAVRFDESGAPTLVKTVLGGSGDARAVGVTLGADGGLGLLVRHDKDVDVDGVRLEEDSNDNSLLVRWAPDGTQTWVQSYVDGVSQPSAVQGIDPWFWTGAYGSDADVGFGPMPGTSRNAFVARHEADGSPGWVTTFGGFGNMSPRSLAMSSELVVSVGTFDRRFSVGGDSYDAVAEDDGFVAAFSPGGVFRFSAVVAGTEVDQGEVDGLAVTITPDLVVVGGETSAPVDFGAGPVTPAGFDAFFAVYRHDGTFVTGAVFGGPGDDVVASATSIDGRVVLGGHLTGPVDILGTAVAAGPSQGFLLALDAEGTAVTDTLLIGGPDGAWVEALADGGGATVAAGRFRGTLELGDATYTSTSEDDVFVTQLLWP